MENFRGLQSLTHLTINLLNDQKIYYNFFLNIDEILPKLQVLCVVNDLSIEVSEQSMDSLARLSRLESIRLEVNNNSIRHLIIDKIMKNCKKIKSIHIF